MIGNPINDVACLSNITDAATDAIDSQAVRNVAQRFDSTRELATWIRNLPQRNDQGDPGDGPRVACPDVSQRLRIPADDPNCIERSALYLAAGEIIDPRPVRQLATIYTPIGPHTFPVEDDTPVKLDPRIPRNALDAGLFRMQDPRPLKLTPRESLEWISAIAAEPAEQYRNGRKRLRNARQTFGHVLRGRPVPRNAVADVGFAFALAEQAARMFGVQGMEIVRMGALALSEVAKRQHRRPPRNLALRIGGYTIQPHVGMLASLARVGGRIGLKVGSAALQAKLAQYGITPPVIRELERELNVEGLTLGQVAEPPPQPGTLAALTTSALMSQRVAHEVT